MNANLLSSKSSRCASFLLAVLTSAGVLGATAFGMDSQAPADVPQLVVMERVVVTGTAVN